MFELLGKPFTAATMTASRQFHFARDPKQKKIGLFVQERLTLVSLANHPGSILHTTHVHTAMTPSVRLFVHSSPRGATRRRRAVGHSLARRAVACGAEQSVLCPHPFTIEITCRGSPSLAARPRRRSCWPLSARSLRAAVPDPARP